MAKKMLLAALLLALASQAVALSCADIKPLTHFNVTQYHGKWVGLAWQTFTNGVLNPPAADATFDGSVVPQCVTSKVRVANSTHICSKTVISINRDETLIKRKKMVMSEGEQGRWNVVSNVPGSQHSEILILAGEPDKYIASLTCGQKQHSAEMEPKDLSIYSRRSSKDGSSSEEQADVALSADELHEVKENVARIIGVAEINPNVLKTDCVHA